MQRPFAAGKIQGRPSAPADVNGASVSGDLGELVPDRPRAVSRAQGLFTNAHPRAPPTICLHERFGKPQLRTTGKRDRWPSLAINNDSQHHHHDDDPLTVR